MTQNNTNYRNTNLRNESIDFDGGNHHHVTPVPVTQTQPIQARVPNVNKVIDYTKLNIHKKITKLRIMISKLNLSKSGKNQHLKFSYFELSDFLPSAIELFDVIGLGSYETVENNEYILTIINTDTLDETVEFKVPFVLPNSIKNPTQQVGAAITYAKRYTYSSLCNIFEPCSLDNSNSSTYTKPAPQQNTQYQNNQAPAPYQPAPQQNNQGYNHAPAQNNHSNRPASKPCPKCGSNMIYREGTGKNGNPYKVYSCENRDGCNNAEWIR